MALKNFCLDEDTQTHDIWQSITIDYLDRLTQNGTYISDIDIEIWNELDLPNFLNTKGSGLSQPDAYALIVEHASRAIRSVDAEVNDGKRIPIIAGVVSSPLNSKYVLPVLNQYKIQKTFDILSFHSYGHEKNCHENRNHNGDLSRS